jgi:O-antigen ligase
MYDRPVWNPGIFAWAVFAGLVVALIYAVAPSHLSGGSALATLFGVLLGVYVIGLLWRLPPSVTMCAALALTIFSGNWNSLGLAGLPLNRILVILVVAQYVLRSPGVAARPRIEFRSVHLLLAFTSLYVIGSAIAAKTIGSESGMLGIFDQIGVAPFVAFVLSPSIFATARDRELLLITLLAVGGYLGLTAFFESVGPRALVFPSHILYSDQSGGVVKATGPFNSSIAEGCATFACGVAATVALAKWRDRRARLSAALVLAVCALGCFLTLERSVWIAAIVAIIVPLSVNRSGRRWLIPGIVAGALLVGSSLALVPGLAQKAHERANYQLSVWDRQNQSAAGVRMVKARPLLGFGLARYDDSSLDYFRQASTYPMTGYVAEAVVGEGETIVPLHNTYLAYAVELGLIGLFCWLGCLLWGIGGAICSRAGPDLRTWKVGLLAITVFFLTVFAVNPLPPPFTTLLLWTWAGLASGSIGRSRGGIEWRAPVISRSRGAI